MNNYLKNKNWIGGILILLAWLSELGEELDMSLWERILRATLMTLVLISAFQLSRNYYSKTQKSKSKWYILIFIFLGLCIVSFLFNFLFLNPFEAIASKKTDYLTFFLFDASLTINILITMFLSWAYYIFEKNKENEQTLIRLEALNKESELNELKKQFNPHFLFNALSNIYSIAYLGDKQTPDKVMQLSKMLRYVIYETDVKSIQLSKEIEYLDHYIDFQKFKIKKEQQIDFDFSNANDDLKIAPLLLLPFIENAFKHSQIDIEPNAWVKIKLNTEGNWIYFTVENSISTQDKPEILNNKGVGLENIKKRVELIYNDNAELRISQTKTYKATLKVKAL